MSVKSEGKRHRPPPPSHPPPPPPDHPPRAAKDILRERNHRSKLTYTDSEESGVLLRSQQNIAGSHDRALLTSRRRSRSVDAGQCRQKDKPQIAAKPKFGSDRSKRSRPFIQSIQQSKSAIEKREIFRNTSHESSNASLNSNTSTDSDAAVVRPNSSIKPKPLPKPKPRYRKGLSRQDTPPIVQNLPNQLSLPSDLQNHDTLSDVQKCDTSTDVQNCDTSSDLQSRDTSSVDLSSSSVHHATVSQAIDSSSSVLHDTPSVFTKEKSCTSTLTVNTSSSNVIEQCNEVVFTLTSSDTCHFVKKETVCKTQTMDSTASYSNDSSELQKLFSKLSVGQNICDSALQENITPDSKPSTETSDLPCNTEKHMDTAVSNISQKSCTNSTNKVCELVNDTKPPIPKQRCSSTNSSCSSNSSGVLRAQSMNRPSDASRYGLVTNADSDSQSDSEEHIYEEVPNSLYAEKVLPDPRTESMKSVHVARAHSDRTIRQGPVKAKVKQVKSERRDAPWTNRRRKLSLTDVLPFHRFLPRGKAGKESDKSTDTKFYVENNSDPENYAEPGKLDDDDVGLYVNADVVGESNKVVICSNDNSVNADTGENTEDNDVRDSYFYDNALPLTREGAVRNRHKRVRNLGIQQSFSGFDGVKTIPVKREDFSNSDISEDEFSDVSSDSDFDEELASKFKPKTASVCAPIYTDKSDRIAQEMLDTEKAYVSRLHLLHMIFGSEIAKSGILSEDVCKEMLLTELKVIYDFHSKTLLPALETAFEYSIKAKQGDIDETDTMRGVHEKCGIGDVMKSYAPFLRLYKPYTVGFDTAMQTIQHWIEKCPEFKELLISLQRRPESMSLTLQHHMLEPIQRIPRYQLLLNDYCKHLSEDSPDYTRAQVALVSVKDAATASNESMKKTEKFRKLLEISESITPSIDLINPSRELLKEGKVTKISASKGAHYERYLFLFNDLILICQVHIGLKASYKLKSKIFIEGVQILEGNDVETPDTIYLKSRELSVQLHFGNLDEKTDWQTSLNKAVADYTKKKQSRLQKLHQEMALDVDNLGSRAPTWVKDSSVSMCMLCCTEFSRFFRKHHCRCCGKVVCSRCSAHRLELAYAAHKEHRVCDSCYQQLNAKSDAADNTGDSAKHKPKKPAVLQVEANQGALLSDYLMICEPKKNWKRRWIAVRSDLVLYVYKAHQDVVAIQTIPLPGYKVSPVDGADANVFKLTHKNYHLHIQAENVETAKHWMAVLEKVTNLEV